jgi:hypothetical protein
MAIRHLENINRQHYGEKRQHSEHCLPKFDQAILIQL